jgi:sporulation protein YlmC with PRC-barrel domain
MKNIFKDYVMLKKYKETERNLNGEIVCFTYNKKTNIINIPHDQIKDVTDISLIKKLVFEKVEFIIDHNFKSFTGKFI